jgi:hypothetical protein
VQLPVLVGIAQVGLALAVVSFTSLQVERYPLPLLGYIGLIVGVTAATAGRRLKYTVLAISLGQIALVDLSAFGYLEVKMLRSRPLQARPGRTEELLDAIYRVAAEERGRRVALATSALGIYSLQVSYHAAKKNRTNLRSEPELSSVEFLLTRGDISSDVELAWAEIEAAKPTHVVLVNEALRRSQRERHADSPHGWGAIMQATVEISERVAGSADYRLVPLSDYPELAVHAWTGSP